MTQSPILQPDQKPEAWDSHVAVYESVFETLTNTFAERALELLEPLAGQRLLDVGAGAGGGALAAARRGARVLAIDASPRMVARINERAQTAGLAALEARAMDGTTLDMEAASFDLAVSIFGVVLFPDADAGMREMHRVLKPGGRIAVVTWTQPQRYELATRLRDAIIAVCRSRGFRTPAH